MSDSLSRIVTYGAVIVLFLSFRGSLGAPPNRVSVGAELERLAEVHGFALVGLDQTEDAFGRAGGDTLYLRLRRLLESFDHVIVQNLEGGVERVIVLGLLGIAILLAAIPFLRGGLSWMSAPRSDETVVAPPGHASDGGVSCANKGTEQAQLANQPHLLSSALGRCLAPERGPMLVEYLLAHRVSTRRPSSNRWPSNRRSAREKA